MTSAAPAMTTQLDRGLRLWPPPRATLTGRSINRAMIPQFLGFELAARCIPAGEGEW